MRRILRNRVFWLGVAVPLLLIAALLAYNVVIGPSADASGRAASSRIPTVSAIGSMSGLSATPAITLPGSLSSAVAAISAAPGSTVPRALAAGSIDTSNAHLLLSDVGSLGASVYAAATRSGKVCLFDTSGPAGCIGQFDAATPVAWLGETTQSGTFIHIVGLAPDDVKSVELDEGSTTQQATLHDNAFYVEPSRTPSAIVVTYSDGTEQSVPISAPRALVRDPSAGS